MGATMSWTLTTCKSVDGAGTFAAQYLSGCSLPRRASPKSLPASPLAWLRVLSGPPRRFFPRPSTLSLFLRIPIVLTDLSRMARSPSPSVPAFAAATDLPTWRQPVTTASCQAPRHLCGLTPARRRRRSAAVPVSIRAVAAGRDPAGQPPPVGDEDAAPPSGTVPPQASEASGSNSAGLPSVGNGGAPGGGAGNAADIVQAAAIPTPPRTARCRRCGETYDPASNTTTSCAFHASSIGAAGAYRLAVASLRTGVVAGISASGQVREVVDEDEEDEPGGADPWGVGEGRDPEKSSRKTRYRSVLVHRWSCCGGERADEPGCRRGSHLSYDDEDERWSGDWNPRFRIF